MAYADLTFNDRNPIKRWLQNRRLYSAASLVSEARPGLAICDFGAGNGALANVLFERLPAPHVTCYEPSNGRMSEAKQNLAGRPRVSYASAYSELEGQTFDIVFSLEVLEHLPDAQHAKAVEEIHALLKPGGRAIIGVPVEIGIPALYKGAFRMIRRYGEYDARIGNVIRSGFGFPPSDRPTKQVAPGMFYHAYHMGYSTGKTAKALRDQFSAVRATYSPVPLFGPLCPEKYFLATR